MDSNNLNDISKIYLEKVSTKLDEKKKEKPKFWWDDDGNGIGYEEGEVSGKFKKKKIKEALIGRQTEIDANRNGEIDAHDFKILRSRSTKKKKQVKEGFSNWREDLVEIADKISPKDTDQKIVEKEVNNKIDINPKLNLGERVDQLGGTLLEISEIEDFEGVFDDLSESEIFLLSDRLIEEVVEEFFYECLDEGYNLGEVENTLLESLEISSAILNEARVTYGHDTDVKSNRLEKVKTAVKNTGKKLVRGAGYLGGLAVRGAKAVGRELGAGYKRGRDGAGGSSSSSSSRPTDTQGSSESQATGSSRPTSTQGSGESQATGSSRPGLLGRIASKLGRGLRKIIHKGARAVQRGAGSVARRTADRPKVTQGRGDDHSKDQRERDLLNRAMYDRVRSHEDHGTPSSVHGKSGVRKPSVRSGIGGGKRIEVAGSGKTDKKEPEIKKVSVRDVTPPKPKPESKAPAGTSENPRVGQPASDKPKPKPEPTVRTRTRTVSTKGFGSFKPSSSGEEAYQKEKEKQETAKSAKKSRTRSSSKKKSKEPNPKKPGAPSLDDLLKSEEFELDEKTLTAAETKQKERIVKSMKDKSSDFEKRYPGRGKEVMYATATKMAKKIAEQAMEIQPKTQQQSGQQNVMQKKVAQQKDRQKQQEVQILQRKLQALRSAPKGVDTNITS